MENRRKLKKQVYISLKRLICVSMIIAFVLSLASCGNNNDWQEQRKSTAKYLLQQIDDGSLPIEDSEWALIGIKNSDIKLSREQLDNYYDAVRAKVKSKKAFSRKTFIPNMREHP